MCTIGGLGRHIGRQSTDILVDYRSAIDRLLVESRPIFDRQSTDSWPMHHPICTHLSVDCRPIYRSTIDRLSADAWADMCTNFYRSTVGRSIGRLSTDSRPIYRPMYRPMYRPICRPRPPIVQMIRKFDSNLPTRQYPKNKKNRQIALSVSVWSFKNNRYLYVKRSVWNSKNSTLRFDHETILLLTVFSLLLQNSDS